MTCNLLMLKHLLMRFFLDTFGHIKPKIKEVQIHGMLPNYGEVQSNPSLVTSWIQHITIQSWIQAPVKCSLLKDSGTTLSLCCGTEVVCGFWDQRP